MKRLFRATFPGICLFLVSCGQFMTPALSPTPSFAATITTTITPRPSETPTPIITPTDGPEYVPPTLIPTIDPIVVPDLLRKAFSIQIIEGSNHYYVQKITGWAQGFGGGFHQGSCPPYSWLDTKHLLLYPAAGQVLAFDQRVGTGVVPQPVIINIETGQTWLPPVDAMASPLTCNEVYWSQDLGILIAYGNYGGRSGIFTFTADGQNLAYYPGGFWGMSPGGTKIRIAEDTLIDLRTSRKITLQWHPNDEEVSSGLYWTSDETRVYRCCYYYADISNGVSYGFEVTDLETTDGKHVRASVLSFRNGEWVRNDTFFLVEWSWVDDGDIRYLPLFDPAQKTFYDVREMVGIPKDLDCVQSVVSPDGIYLWLACWDGNFLINLITFESVAYPSYWVDDFQWSSDSKFAWLSSSDAGNPNSPAQFEILSVSNQDLKPFAVNPIIESSAWHPRGSILAYLSEDGEKLELLNAQSMSNQELALPNIFQTIAWSPSGDYIALLAKDGSMWQVDYPALENLEQLTQPLHDVHDMNWSPDGNSIAFMSGSDIYIVDTTK